ncbi:MAG TPA: hypothetical protein VGG26_10250 [Terracidiphilus sp.]|jgi:hypothetical protein
MNQTILAAVSAVAGFIAKSVWDLYWNRRESIAGVARQKRIDFLERQLADFYWPIYLRLQKDNVVWETILDRRPASDPLRQSIAGELDRKYILPNHEEVVRLIEAGMHLAQCDAKLENALLHYMRHVAIYRALRDTGCFDKDPIALGEPWPQELFPLIQERTKSLQKEYDLLISRRGLSG